MMDARVSGIWAVAALLLVQPAAAQVKKTTAEVARVAFVPPNSHPPIPAGLKVSCLKSPNSGAPSLSCPVVKYQGITTWAYSFLDNSVALALVSYDAQNNVVRNVTKNGVRYVWNMISSVHTKTVLVEGQTNANVTVNWTDLGTP